MAEEADVDELSAKINALSVKDLKELIAESGLSSDDCIDEADLRARGRDAYEALKARYEALKARCAAERAAAEKAPTAAERAAAEKAPTANYVAPQSSLPALDYGAGPHLDLVRVQAWIIPRPGLCRLVEEDGSQCGFLLAMAMDGQDYRCVHEMYSEMFDMLQAEMTPYLERKFVQNPRCKTGTVLGALKDIATAREYARCYGTSQQVFGFLPVLPRDDAYVIDAACFIPNDRVQFMTLPAHGHGNSKCCMASQLTDQGCPACGGPSRKLACLNGCSQTHERMIWCKGCHIACFCSRDCQSRSRAAHALPCVAIQHSLLKLGVGRVCFFCGVPEIKNGPKLKQCNRCKAAFYCSRDCQVNDWKAGHKEACGAAPSVTGDARGIASGRSKGRKK